MPVGPSYFRQRTRTDAESHSTGTMKPNSGRLGAEHILRQKPWEIPAPAATMGLVDEEVQYLRDTIRNLHTHRNTLAPFSRLPRELITRIFQYLMPTSTGCGLSNGREWSLDAPTRWIAFAQTCTLWRNIALASNFLWSDLYLPSPSRSDVKLFSNMLARCGSKCSISVKADITRRSEPYYTSFWAQAYGRDSNRGPGSAFQEAMEALTEALDNPSRLRALDLLAPIAELGSLASRITGRVPDLKKLRLTTPPIDLQSANDRIVVAFEGLDAPNLNHLNLSGISSLWMPIAGQNITHLRIASHRPKMSVADMLHVLERLPALTVLHLQDVMSHLVDDLSHSDEECDGGRSIRLSHASQFTVIEPPGPCSALLRQLTLPTTCDIRVTCGQEASAPAPPSKAPNIIASLAIHLQRMRRAGPLDSFKLDPGAHRSNDKEELQLSCTSADGHTLDVTIAALDASEYRQCINTLLRTMVRYVPVDEIDCCDL